MSQRRALSVLLALSLLAAVLALAAPRAGAQDVPETILAGYGVADATWNVGAGAGQYSDKRVGIFGELGGGDIDPQGHATTQTKSYGVQSRLTYRAIVVQGTNGERVALVKSDNYLAQDYLSRRVGQILAAEGSGVTYDGIFHMASHNHSSPYYSTPSWGVWLFQDAFDLRAFEYHARQMAAAILEAEANLVPAKMGGTTVTHRAFKGQIQRATIADDGTPGGYPADYGDFGLSVLRFDALDGSPIASLMNFGQHPESLDWYALITADFLGPLERFVERDTGAPVVFGQGDVGSAEAGSGHPEDVPAGIVPKWSHVGHAQAERGARLLADSVVEAWNEIGRGEGTVPFSSDFPVRAGNAWVPGPLSHPYPSVSNCRSESTVEGNPGSPIVGLPDCARAGGNNPANQQWENLKAEGVPVPDHYDAPGFTAVEENARLHLQAFRLGEVILASCACEAQVDLILNLESRLDSVVDNFYDGYDWTERLGCTQAGDGGDWTCTHPQNANQTITFSDARYRRMKAQIHNDAAGWDAPENAVAANSEPSDPEQIWGNFTKEELEGDLGYALPIGFGHTTDYNGYTVSYREYMGYDSYRKALTAYGPHTADYMNTRLVRLAGELKGGPALAPEPHDGLAQADEIRQVAMATVLGVASEAAYDAWYTALPNDVGPAAPVTQPENITRFDAATFTWRGGSNAVDNPFVTVERLVDGEWVPYADQSGEVQTMVDFPNGVQGVAGYYSGNQEWLWTANFEAFDAFPASTQPGGQVPNGTYRFVVDGAIRQNGSDEAYRFASDEFHVGPWDGIEVSGLSAHPDGSVTFTVDDVVYPETYESVFPFIQPGRDGGICERCSFRPWATSGRVATASVTVIRALGGTETVPATFSNGVWRAETALGIGDRAFIDAGGVTDTNGEINGAPTPEVTGL